MTDREKKRLGVQIIEKAGEFGASLAGITSVGSLKTSPSHVVYGKFDKYRGVGTKKAVKPKPGMVWPEHAQSAVVIAVYHPEEKPELDGWRNGYKGGTPGNRILMHITDKLSDWLKAEKRIRTIKLPYHIESGGIFLKDAAVMAGIGCLGKNNMLVTRNFGPRVRLRAMFAHEHLSPTGPIDFDPCKGCPMPCREACPEGAFRRRMYTAKDFGIEKIPAGDGTYSRDACNIQMQQDAADRVDTGGKEYDGTEKPVRFCRQCEWACPV